MGKFLGFITAALSVILAAACTLTTQPPQTPTLIPPATPEDTPTVVVIDARETPVPTDQAGGDNTRPNCTPRTDWPLFAVPEGMTLTTIAFLGGTTVQVLADANCLANPDNIFAGQSLRVPPDFPPTVPPEFESAAPRSRVGISPYLRFEGGWYEVQPGSMVSLGWEPALPASVTRIEFYATPTGTNQQPALIAVDNNGGDNVWINWTIPAQFAGQITAVAYRGEAVHARTDDPINVYTSLN